MAVKTQCPRCKQPLSVPNKLAGSFASCPRCQGRFWVSKDAPLDPSVNDSAGLPSASTLTLTEVSAAIPPGRPLPPVLPGSGPAIPPPVPPRQYFPSVTPPAPVAPLPVPLPPGDGSPAAPPVAPPQSRKVARLVSAEAAQSTLKLAADGQLPQLQLQEGDENDKRKGKSRSIPPLVMIGAWIFSVAITAAIVMINSGDGSSAITQEKAEAMTKIEEQFFGNPARGELLSYQRLLREAREARARGDFKAERHCYKQVLDLLHTETWGSSESQVSRSRLEKGITGSRAHDQDLEKLILAVLKD
jgi:hypothetical protein